MPRPLTAARPPRRARSAAAAATGLPPLLVLLAGCALAGGPLPAPEPGVRRELVAPGGGSCRDSRCTASVVVGGRRFVVTSRTRLVSPDEVTGRPRRPLLARVAGALGGAMLDHLPGATVTDIVVGTGTRTVAASDDGPGAGLRLACELAWVDRERRERGGDETQAAVQAERVRLAEGLACRAAPAAGDDSAVEWRIRRGFTPGGGGLVAAVDSARALDARPDSGARAAAARPLVLERLPGPGLAPERYTIASDPDGPDPTVRTARRGTAARWLVRRPDGRAVGALVSRLLPVAAVDVLPGASADEAAVLRLLSACLAEPIE
jgi:hypothetical protein